MRLRTQARRRRHVRAFRPEIEQAEPMRLLSTLSEFPIPGGPDIGAKTGITAGPDGAIWFVSSTDERVGRLGRDGQFSFVNLPQTTTGDDPTAITLGPDGNLWFLRSSEVGYVTPTGQVTEFPIGGPPLGAPNAIVSGPDGNVYFTGQNYLARVSTTGEIIKFAFPAEQTSAGNVTRGLVVGPDGNLWFTRNDLMGSTYPNQVGRMTLDGRFTFFDLTSGFDGVSDLTVGPDGRLWFTEGTLEKVGAISMAGQVTEYSAPTDSLPRGLTTGPDGCLYVALNGSNAIGRLTTDGQWTTVPLPSMASQPQAIVLGSDGQLWFTEGNGSAIGLLNPTSLSKPPSSESPGTASSQKPATDEPTPPGPMQGPFLIGQRPQTIRQRRLAMLEAWRAHVQARRMTILARREVVIAFRMRGLGRWHRHSERIRLTR